MERSNPVSLSECERNAIRNALKYGDLLVNTERLALGSLLERSAPAKPSVRFVVKCQGYVRKWEKVFFDKTAAQQYARHAAATWCGREGVRIMKQKWIAF